MANMSEWHDLHNLPTMIIRPAMVLVTELDTGSFLVQAYPTGATRYVSAENSTALRDALDTAFDEGSTEMHLPPLVRPRFRHE
ncbi:MAG: hypothetical protein ACREA0_28710 [bacterium]